MTKGQDLVHGERQSDYGLPDAAHEAIAKAWTAVLYQVLKPGAELTKEHVAMCMIGLKLVRETNKHKPDNLDDIDGYNEILKIFHGESTS